ncbi:exported hypothetical protein [Mesorhizobium plurifarium]|uniref:Uncharacterized protein n=1 Tax=Mesorhizobium plurifarium TaxID=69974 RepID=A0A0K2VYQ7_MESPL|nr:exported hypothetical protein [Mesorhizobium plurifarium]
MSPAFVVVLVALAAILAWAFISKAKFERHVKNRMEREKVLGERAAAYRAKLKEKSEELQKRLDTKASEKGTEPVDDLMAALLDHLMEAAEPRRYVMRTEDLVPVINPHPTGYYHWDDRTNALERFFSRSTSFEGGVIRERAVTAAPVNKPRAAFKGASKR